MRLASAVNQQTGQPYGGSLDSLEEGDVSDRKRTASH